MPSSVAPAKGAAGWDGTCPHSPAQPGPAIHPPHLGLELGLGLWAKQAQDNFTVSTAPAKLQLVGKGPVPMA